MNELLNNFLYTFFDVFSFNTGNKPLTVSWDVFLVNRWCTAAILFSIVIFVLTVIWPILKKKQISIAAIFLTMTYVAIWLWWSKNSGAEHDLAMAVMLTLFCGFGGYMIWTNRQLYKTKKVA